MSLQETFDWVARHLMTQGEKSTSPASSPNNFGCMYRTTSTDRILSCAIGCLIPDDAYDARAEGMSISDLTIVSGRWTAVDDSEHLATMLDLSGIEASQSMHALLKDLQHVHDRCDVQWWSGVLRSVARQHGLIFRELT